MEKGAAVVANTLGITKGIDLMEKAGKATGGMMQVLVLKSFFHLLFFSVLLQCDVVELSHASLFHVVL
jgi:hypothetical protein